MTGQDEREVAIRIIAPYVTLVCNDRQGGGLPECEHTTTGRVRSEKITDALLAAGFHLTPTAEVKAEALEEAADYWFETGVLTTPVQEEFAAWLRSRATHLRENGGA